MTPRQAIESYAAGISAYCEVNEDTAYVWYRRAGKVRIGEIRYLLRDNDWIPQMQFGGRNHNVEVVRVE